MRVCGDTVCGVGRGCGDGGTVDGAHVYDGGVCGGGSGGCDGVGGVGSCDNWCVVGGDIGVGEAGGGVLIDVVVVGAGGGCDSPGCNCVIGSDAGVGVVVLHVRWAGFDDGIGGVGVGGARVCNVGGGSDRSWYRQR